MVTFGGCSSEMVKKADLKIGSVNPLTTKLPLLTSEIIWLPKVTTPWNNVALRLVYIGNYCWDLSHLIMPLASDDLHIQTSCIRQ